MPALIILTIEEFQPENLIFTTGKSQNAKIKVKVNFIPTNSPPIDLRIKFIIEPSLYFMFSNNRSIIEGTYYNVSNDTIIEKKVVIKKKSSFVGNIHPPIVIKVDGNDINNPATPVNTDVKEWDYIDI